MSVNIDLDQSVRQQLAQQLGFVLADLYVLYVKTQNFHWNVVDPRFYSLHKFFEDHYEEMAEKIDEIAERIRILGERAPGSLRQFIEMSSLEESVSELNGDEMIQNLLQDHETLVRHLRDRILYAGKFEDEGTADLLIDLLRFHEKASWMLRSHLTNGRG